MVKSLGKEVLEKKKSETLLKIISYYKFLKNFSSNSYVHKAHPELCLKQQYGYIDKKTIYRGEPKDRNIETEQIIYRHTERVDSIRKDKVETRLK